MANAYDPYREALVVEVRTIWPVELLGIDDADRPRIERQLHDQPQEAAAMDYDRMHTGFCRTITVTATDLERLGVSIV